MQFLYVIYISFYQKLKCLLKYILKGNSSFKTKLFKKKSNYLCFCGEKKQTTGSSIKELYS